MKTIKIIKNKLNEEEKTDSINKYFNEIRKINLLSKDEEIELAKKIKETDDPKLIDKLIKSNLRFVISVAKQFQNQGLSLEDLINEGNIGLIIAAKKFDYTRGYKFITYAVWWIKQSILQSLSENSRIIRLPFNQISMTNKINNLMNRLEQENEGPPSYDKISKLLDIDFEKIDETLKLTTKCISIDETLNGKSTGYNDSENYTLLDIYENENSISPDTKLINNFDAEKIRNLLENLTYKEKEIINLSYGLYNNSKMSLEFIGKKFDISKERVRQIRDKTIRKIRANYQEI